MQDVGRSSGRVQKAYLFLSKRLLRLPDMILMPLHDCLLGWFRHGVYTQPVLCTGQQVSVALWRPGKTVCRTPNWSFQYERCILNKIKAVNKYLIGLQTANEQGDTSSSAAAEAAPCWPLRVCVSTLARPSGRSSRLSKASLLFYMA